MASRWSTKRSGSRSSAAGSMGSASVRRSGVRRGQNGSSSSPRDRAWIRAPSSPKRATNADRASSAMAPIRRRPNRVSLARTSGSGVSRPDGCGARKAASPPGGTTIGSAGRARTAAIVAAKRVPAIPARISPCMPPAGPVSARPSAETSRPMRIGSGPQSGSRPSIWTSNSPKPGSLASALPATPGLNAASASKAASTIARSASGSGSMKIASGTSRWALPSGIPRRTPRARASGSASTTGPGSHGRPPRMSGPGGKGSEARARASSSGRCGR